MAFRARQRLSRGARRAPIGAFECFLLLWLVAHQLAAPALVEAAVGINLQAGKPLGAPIRLSPPEDRQPSPADVDLFSGQATTRIPIQLPPGTAGHTPTVALTYASHSSNTEGPIGVGWSLDVGPATIERSTKLGAPGYTPADIFLLGGKELRPTATADLFVTEEFDHSLVEFVAGHWRVLRPDGTRLYYGSQSAPSANPPNQSLLSSILVLSSQPTQATCSDPLQSNCPKEQIVAPGQPFAWYLDRVEDRNGNVIHYRWEDLGDPGMRYLVEIRYSSHVSGAISAVPHFGGPDDLSLSRIRQVRFVYGLVRNEAMPTYRAGFPRLVGHRLTEIIAEVDGNAVRSYALDYESSPVSGRTRLASLRERDAGGTPATERVYRFGYGDGVARGWGQLAERWKLPAGLTLAGADRGVRVFDINGDGWSDVVEARDNTLRTYLGGPTGFIYEPEWQFPAPFVRSEQYTGLVVGDLDGDGLPDLVKRKLRVTGTLSRSDPSCGNGLSNQHEIPSGSNPFDSAAWLNDGTGWDPAPSHDLPPTRILTVTNNAAEASCPDEYLPTAIEMASVTAGFDQATRLVDVNGDGIDDLVYKRATTGFTPSSSEVLSVDEERTGVVINSETGLVTATPNHHHLATSRLGFRQRAYPCPSARDRG